MEKLSVRDLPLKGRRALIRVDFNVPLSSEGTISDDTRIQAALPTIRYCLEKGASIILMSHLGRPNGKRSAKDSLTPCAERLSELLETPVTMLPDCIGPEIEQKTANLQPGQVVLLENLRFHLGEEHPESDPTFPASLAKLGDLYINDAFGTAHRAHASTCLIAQFFPHKAAMGFLMEKEILALGSLLQKPKRPYYAILGGAKVSTKIGVIKNLLPKIDALFIGGAMAYTFLHVKGLYMGSSLIDSEELPVAKDLLIEAENKKIPLYLPLDLVVAEHFHNDSPSQIVTVEEGVPSGWQGMGIGPQTVDAWSRTLKKASTIFWNGPLSVFEMPQFAYGTFAIAKTLAEIPATVIVGGGDSVAAIQQAGLADQFDHLSTGGGASLEFIELGHLPGIDSLSNKK